MEIVSTAKIRQGRIEEGVEEARAQEKNA